MSIARDGWLWIIPLLAGAMALGFLVRRHRLRGLERYLNSHPGPELWPPPPGVEISRSFDGLRLSLLLLSGSLLGFSALGPSFGTRAVPVSVAEEPLILLVDVSHSMGVGDAPGSRQDFARLMVRRILASVPEVPVALGIFAGDAQLVLPPSTDHALVLGMADAAAPTPFSGRGTRLAPALEMLLAWMQSGAWRDGPGVVVLSDGEDFGPRGRALEMAREIRRRGGWICTLSMGTATGGMVPIPGGAGGGSSALMPSGDGADDRAASGISRADAAYMAQVAREGGGVAARSGSMDEVNDLLAFLGEWRSEQVLGVSVEKRPLELWPLFLGLAIAGLGLEAVLEQVGFKKGEGALKC